MRSNFSRLRSRRMRRLWCVRHRNALRTRRPVRAGQCVGVRQRMNTLTLTEAAGFLKMHPEEVRCRAKRGLIPASKPGRRWVFIDDDLAAFLRGKYPTQRQALRVTSEKGSAPWESANEARSGGSISRRQQASVYADLLKPKTGAKPKNSTTS